MFAIYTCFYGTNRNWANCIPTLPDDVDGYYFTNNSDTAQRVSQTRWRVVYVDIPMSDDNVVCAEQTKILRTCPHKYPVLRSYPYLCWMDSKLQITDINSLHKIIAELKSSSSVWAFTRHPIQYRDVWGEYHESIQHEKYARQKDRYDAYIHSRIAMGYDPYTPQRVCCGFHIRKQCPLTEEIGQMWYNEIQDCGIEDQISWQFVHQKYEDAILMFPYQYCWSYV